MFRAWKRRLAYRWRYRLWRWLCYDRPRGRAALLRRECDRLKDRYAILERRHTQVNMLLWEAQADVRAERHANQMLREKLNTLAWKRA